MAAGDAFWHDAARGQERRDWRRAFAVALPFLLATAALWAFHQFHDIRSFPYDAGHYWVLAIAPEQVPPQQSIRGYLYPALLRMAVSAGAMFKVSPEHSLRVLSSILSGAALGLLVPAVYARLSGTPTSTARRLATAALVVLVFPGLFLYPLTDFPALALMWLAVWCALYLRDAPSRGRAIGMALLGGAAAAAAYNTRTIYMFGIALLVAGMLWHLRGRRYLVALFVAGAALVTAPQVLVNQRVHGVTSVSPMAGIGNSLFMYQLRWGFWAQKYETSIAPDAVSPAFVYLDPAGVKLAQEICREARMDSFSDYAAAVLRHPLDFLGLYARHFVNAIDVRDGLVYVKRAGAPDARAGFLPLTVLLLALLGWHAWRRGGAGAPERSALAPRGHAVYVAALLAPVAAILPGAVETRFMLPLLMLVLVMGAAHWSLRTVLAELRRHPWEYLLAAVAAYALFFAVTQSTAAALQHKPAQVDCMPPTLQP